MNTNSLRAINLGMVVLFSTFLFTQRALPQEADSVFQCGSGSLQFQLFGGFGVNYIGELGPASFFRVGVDGHWGHSNNEGDGDSYSRYMSTSGGNGSYSVTSQPEQNSTSYVVSISALYAREIVEYGNASLYAGVGPMAFYSKSKYSNKSTSTRIEAGTTNVDSYASSSTNKTWGLGPFAILGVKGRLLKQISVSAEMSLSGLHEWDSGTNASRSIATVFPSGNTTTNDYGSNSHTKGWAFSLSNIRIGVIIGL